MSASEPIVCKPTAWFLFRAAVLFLMFAVFAALFYLDGSSGYRADNRLFHLHRCFKKASEDFAELNADQQLTAEKWETHAKDQVVDFPSNPDLLPRQQTLPMPWPQILSDFERMKSLQWNQLWLDYTAAEGLDSKPPEKAHDARSIREQWIFFYICSFLAAISLFFLIRTSRRHMTADAETLTSQDGRRIAYSDFIRLDLRKWDNKGIAIAEYDGDRGKGRIRIDGLTYGGFKKEQGKPAEKLMQRLRSRFSGEVLEYRELTEESDSESQNESKQPKSENSQ